MTLKQLINKSCYGSIGYISSSSDLLILERYILYNLNILLEFDKIIIALNYDDNLNLATEIEKLYNKYFQNVVILHSKFNRGHNFGTADLDNMIINYCKSNQIEFLFKSSNDIILNDIFLNLSIPEELYDFYYLNGISYNDIRKYNFDKNKLYESHFYPQTNSYFINVSKIDFLNNENYLKETFIQSLSIQNYNGKIWEYIPEWSCENFLKKCVERNNLSKLNLISLEKFNILYEYIKNYKIGDPSHKNIMICGICHFHNINKEIIII